MNSNLSSEEWRLECEARYWLAQTRGNPVQIKDCLHRLQKKRGSEQVALREAMRKQWQQQKNG